MYLFVVYLRAMDQRIGAFAAHVIWRHHSISTPELVKRRSCTQFPRQRTDGEVLTLLGSVDCIVTTTLESPLHPFPRPPNHFLEVKKKSTKENFLGDANISLPQLLAPALDCRHRQTLSPLPIQDSEMESRYCKSTRNFAHRGFFFFFRSADSHVSFLALTYSISLVERMYWKSSV